MKETIEKYERMKMRRLGAANARRLELEKLLSEAIQQRFIKEQAARQRGL